MTGTKFAKYIRNRTKTNAITFNDVDLVDYANANKDILAELIENNVDERYFEIQHERNLVENQREYSINDDVLLGMSEIAVKFDGENYSYPTEIQRGQVSSWADEAGIQSEFANNDPRFLITGRGFVLFNDSAIPYVQNGMKIVSNIYPEDISDTDIAGSYDLSIPQDPDANLKHAMPRAAHKVWATMVIIDYKQSKEKPIPLTEQEKQIKVMQDEMFAALRQRNNDRTFVASTPQNNGGDY